MIVQIRASMGAGKSTLVRRLLVEHNGEKLHRIQAGIQNGKPRMMDVWRCDGNLYVLGNYKLDGPSPGGGGDPLYGARSAEVMRHYAQFGHVLHEGARAAAQRPNGWLPDLLGLPDLRWVLFDTPFEESVRRIYQRREERQTRCGDSLNVKSLEQNYRAIKRFADEGAAAGIPVVTLNDEHAYAQLHDLLVYGGWQCSHHPLRWNWPPVQAA